jgi:hypothetical protein
MKCYIIGVFISISLSAAAQVTISFGTGYGKYAMGDLIKLQQDFMKSYNVNAKVNAAFPGYVYYQGSVGISYSRLFYSEIFFCYGSTGGRVSYADYSGQFAMGQKVNFKSVTGSFGVRWWATKKLQLECVIRTGPVASTLALEAFQNIGADQWTHKGKYESDGWMMEPNFKATRVAGHFGIFAFVGLNRTKANFFESVDFVDYITTPQGTYYAAPDWSGLRVGTGVTFMIGGKKNSKD